MTLTHSAAKVTWGGDGAVEIDFNNHEMTNVDIDSGTIDDVAIGGATPAAGAFTTVTASGGFGCNGQAAQTAYDSGGALAAYGTGAFGLDSDANMSALHVNVL